MNVSQRADEILKGHTDSWPDRREFLATVEEIKRLVQAGAKWKVVNHNNQDGTYYNEVVYKDYTFKSSTTEKV